MQGKVVIFDLDGTLLDTVADLGAAVNYALELRGFPTHTPEEYRSMVGHGVRDLVSKALPAGKEDLTDGVLADFKEYYTSHIDVYTRPYPGMQELLKKLNDSGISLAIASNKFQEGTERLAEEFFPGIPFAAILGNRPGYPLKPDPEIVREALRSAGYSEAEAAAPCGQAVMVGDSRSDMLTAANGGIRGIAVTWGYRTLEPSPSYTLVSSPQELERALLQ